jgi:hypothetical protein
MAVGTSTHGRRQEDRKRGICPSPTGVLEKIKIEKGRNYTKYYYQN